MFTPSLQSLLLVLCCLLVVFGSSACYYPPPTPLPTIGPVNGGGGRARFLDFDFSASTNCAAIGETVVFTVVVTATATDPVILTATPPLEITLEPRRWRAEAPPPLRRWSDSPAYPSAIDPVLRPGEQRTYTWEWTAEQVYGDSGVLGVTATLFTTIDDRGIDQGADGVLYVGVEAFELPGTGDAGLPCTEMSP